MRRLLLAFAGMLCFLGAEASDSIRAKSVYVFPIRENIMPSVATLTSKCLAQAAEMGSDLVIIDMNTYGGLLDAADSIRTSILNCPIPVYVFINNQAASAGALIAIAADSIFMREGANIGAATVVSPSGEAMPDKYQSFMRAMMRSTAESHGRVETTVNGRTASRWFRDPLIAEAMVDPGVVVPGLSEEGKVLTFTTEEAIKNHYCEGRASSVDQVLALAGVDNYTIHRYTPTRVDSMLSFFTNPAFQGILIMLIVGGIYFELQTPGVGFPLVVSIAAAVLYFAPLYIEGLASNWEMALFVLGVVLVLVEIFAIPGFGVTGITGIAAMVVGLAFAMIDTDLLKYIPSGEISSSYVLLPFSLVAISVTAAIILSIWLGRKFLTGNSRLQNRVVLVSDLSAEQGYISHIDTRNLVGREGVTATALRPAGRVRVDGAIYEATAENGLFIEKNSHVEIVNDENGVLYCKKK